MAITGFNHTVQWGEFREVSQRPADETEDAHIAATYRYSYRTQSSGQHCRVTGVTTRISVNRNATWVVRAQKSADLLRYEQGHYDITALGAREVDQRIAALSAEQCSSIGSDVQRIQREVQQLIHQKDLRYDNQTSHGTNAAAQQRWEASIRRAKQNASGTLADLP